MNIEIGISAPDFVAKNDIGVEVKLSDNKGKWVVLYFYPKDDTSGCTAEACSFRDNMEIITDIGAVVIGVSPDSVKSHTNFKQKYNLNFNLISDSEKEICNIYEIMGEKSMFGKKYMGVIRSTFIISPDGKISYIYRNVKIDGHVEDIISKLKDLMSN
jgi:thioredoxin-dependent peroxiredoxin